MSPALYRLLLHLNHLKQLKVLRLVISEQLGVWKVVLLQLLRTSPALYRPLLHLDQLKQLKALLRLVIS